MMTIEPGTMLVGAEAFRAAGCGCLSVCGPSLRYAVAVERRGLDSLREGDWVAVWEKGGEVYLCVNPPPYAMAFLVVRKVEVDRVLRVALSHPALYGLHGDAAEEEMAKVFAGFKCFVKAAGTGWPQ